MIGTDAAGAGNSSTGIQVLNSGGNTIGGTAAGAGNVISGNPSFGLDISGASSMGNVVQGNLIGTNAAGTEAVGNFAGVRIVAANNNALGGTAAGAGNTISGNTGQGGKPARAAPRTKRRWTGCLPRLPLGMRSNCDWCKSGVQNIGHHVSFDNPRQVVHRNLPQPRNELAFGGPANPRDIAMGLEERLLAPHHWWSAKAAAASEDNSLDAEWDDGEDETVDVEGYEDAGFDDEEEYDEYNMVG